MSILFTPMYLGNVEIKNRFVHSATYEVMASEEGEVTEELIKRYQRNFLKRNSSQERSFLIHYALLKMIMN